MQHTLLLVDDKSENLDFFRTILKPQGYNILPAENVDYGASIVKRYKGKISLALIDHNMPGKNGDEAIRLFRSIDPTGRMEQDEGVAFSRTRTQHPKNLGA